MKNLNIRLFSLILVLSFAFTTSFAQQKETSEVVIIQKIENADGTTTTVKKVIQNKKDLKAVFEQLHEKDAKDVDLHIVTEDVENVTKNSGDMIMYFRKANSGNEADNKEVEQFKIFMSGEMGNLELHDEPREREKVVKPLLGVYVDESHDRNGLKLSGIVDGKGSQAAGLQSGDIVTKVNGTAVNNVYDLRNVLNNHKPGETVNVAYTRDGQTATAPVVLSEKVTWRHKRNPCKVFIGVQLGGQHNVDRGVNVDGIIQGWPADKAGVLAGDVIVALDDVEVHNHHDLLVERNKHKPGEYFTLSVLRNGVEMDIEAQFRNCEEEPQAIEEPIDETETEEEIIDDTPRNTPDDGPVDNSDLLEEFQLDSYKAFPNPTYGKVRVQFVAEEAPTTIQLIDVTGKVLFKEHLWHFDGYYNKEIDITDGTPGTVVVHITQDGKTVSKKIVLMPRA